MKIRKQVYELGCTDLTRCAVWEFALDEETEAGQDEATVRPWEGTEPLDPADGMFVIRAAFVLADGTEHMGYLTPPARGDASIGTIQPIIVTDKGQVVFWRGVMAPASEAIRSAYGQLGRTAEEVFPCRYVSAVTLKSGPVAGSVNGFMHYRSFSDRTVVEVR
jgi:hypothetical protein